MKKLYRKTQNSLIGGVCSGIGQYFNIDVMYIRLIFIGLLIVSIGAFLIPYILIWIITPKNFF